MSASATQGGHNKSYTAGLVQLFGHSTPTSQTGQTDRQRPDSIKANRFTDGRPQKLKDLSRSQAVSYTVKVAI